MALLAACGKKDTPPTPTEPEETIRIYYLLEGLTLSYDALLLVNNVDGDNLLDPEVEENILCNEITVRYKGATYPLCEENPGTGYWLGMDALMSSTPPPPNIPVLRFFVATEEKMLSDGYRDQEFSIDWGDGTETKVKYAVWLSDFSSEEIKYERGVYPVIIGRMKGEEEVERTYAIYNARLWIDGELVSDNSLVGTIVKGGDL